MPHVQRLGAAGAVLGWILLGMASGSAYSAADQAGSAAPTERSAWKHHHVTFAYFGITAAYTCDSLEDKVKQILLYVGARQDAQVQATGCPRGPSSLSHQAVVTVDFDTLQAAPDSSDADSVQARWADMQVAPRHPRFMDEGDCELIDGMRPVLKDGFSWRGLDYSTSCFPHELPLDGFAVRGAVLRPAAPVAAH